MPDAHPPRRQTLLRTSPRSFLRFLCNTRPSKFQPRNLTPPAPLSLSSTSDPWAWKGRTWRGALDNPRKFLSSPMMKGARAHRSPLHSIKAPSWGRPERKQGLSEMLRCRQNGVSPFSPTSSVSKRENAGQACRTVPGVRRAPAPTPPLLPAPGSRAGFVFPFHKPSGRQTPSHWMDRIN